MNQYALLTCYIQAIIILIAVPLAPVTLPVGHSLNKTWSLKKLLWAQSGAQGVAIFVCSSGPN